MTTETERHHAQEDRAEMLESIRRAVHETYREFRLLEMPGCVHEIAPPNAVDAEEKIVSALLCGHTSADQLGKLDARDFFVPLHRAIVAACDAFMQAGEDVTMDAVVAKIEAQGFRGELVAAITELRDGVPFVIDLSDCIARVHEASRRRRLLAWLRRLEADVATAAISVDDAIARIRKAGGRAE